jgi:triosephosphate isomerase (TIM)
MKKKLVVANWKMHLNASQASLLVSRLHKHLHPYRDVDVVLAPSMLVIQPLSLQIDRRQFRLAAQNAYFKDEGAFTGEVSFTMLQDLVHYCIIGHSERRLYFHEDLPMIRDKVSAAIRNEIIPILCIGDTKEEKRLGETKQTIHDQLVSALSNLTSDDVQDVVVVYEPVWAISTFEGEFAKPADVKRAMQYIKLEISELYGETTANRVRLLYGGSVNETTVSGYLAIEECDGVLVGADSLNYLQFAGIVEEAHKSVSN